jgi:hypothetical protein
MLEEQGCPGCELLIQCLSTTPMNLTRAHCSQCRALCYGIEKAEYFVDLNITKDIDKWAWTCPRIGYFMGDLTTVVCAQCKSKKSK